jgi:hypothetical protein
MIGLAIMTAVFGCILAVQLATGRALVWWDDSATRSTRPMLYWQSVTSMGLVVLLLVIMLFRTT